MNLEPKDVTCPCGEVIRLGIVDEGDGLAYDVCGVECPKCHRRSGGGNYKKGTVDGWMTRKQIDESEREYERQQFSADMNEWEGRGNHPF